MMNIDNKSNPATEAKQRWNEKHYTQIKAHISSEVASAFKAACAASGVSMAGVLTQFMLEYSGTSQKRRTASEPDYSTRGKRRATMKYFAQQTEMIRAAEERCRDNIPENLQGSSVYETADEYVSRLEEAAELLSDIY